MAERKSIYHGQKSDGHGPDEHGLGGLPSPEDPRDFAAPTTDFALRCPKG